MSVHLALFGVPKADRAVLTFFISNFLKRKEHEHLSGRYNKHQEEGRRKMTTQRKAINCFSVKM